MFIMSLRTKILSVCLACTLLALLLQGVLFVSTSSSVIYNKAKEESIANIENMQYEISVYLENMQNKIGRVYQDTSFVSDLANVESISELRTEHFKLASNLVSDVFETSDRVVSLYMYTKDHELISSYRKTSTPLYNYPANIYMSDVFNGATIQNFVDSDERGMLVSSYYHQKRKTNIVHLVMKIYDVRQYKNVTGYIVCDVDSVALVNIMKKYQIDDSMYIWLQPTKEQAITSIGAMTETEEAIYNSISIQVEDGIKLQVESNDNTQQELVQVEQTDYNLTAYALIPKEVLEENQNALMTDLVIIIAVMAIVAFIVVFFVSRTISKPVVELHDVMKQVKSGDLDKRAKIQTKDEIGDLAKEFNEMLNHMEVFREQEQRQAELLGMAEYKALQAQINPHFLYNTLDTMSSIAIVNGCMEVSDLSQSLSNIFRYALNIHEPLSSIEKELEHLRNYIMVMDIRMRDCVQYIYEIDEQALNTKIPRLSLQPLVENALTHGLRNKRGDKRVRICVSIQGENVVGMVEDNGVGMDADAMNRKLQENNTEYIEKGTSIGLFNINARLKLLYGVEYGLKIESKINKGTRIIFEVPRRENEE